MTAWLDANVILRFLTGDPADLAAKARRVIRRASDDEVGLRVATVVIAEVVWVLGSYYQAPRDLIADQVRGLVLADGIDVENREAVLDALRMMQDANVSFVDAYLATLARAGAEPVVTFDAAFKRLGVEVISN